VLLPQIGESGQAKLSRAKIVLIGVGGLGSSAAFYLAAAGVGTLGIVDHDTVHASNLNRQILYGADDIGKQKVAIAEARIKAFNPDIKVNAHNLLVDFTNAAEVLQGYDIVIDATDSLDAKFMLNDVCVAARKTLIHAGVEGFIGQIMAIVPGSSCLRCLMPQMPQDGYSKSNPRPVFGITAGMLGQLQAAEAIKCALNISEGLAGRILFVDLLRMEFKKKTVLRDPACPACGKKGMSK
jgi:molybdopterin/thiamine biosynthesis adenylyltransferase